MLHRYRRCLRGGALPVSRSLAARLGTVVALEPMSNFSISKRLNSFRDAGRGLVTTVTSQHNAWIHMIAATLVVVLGLAVGLSLTDWKWLTLTITMVWFAETINTAFEYLCDVVSPEYNEAVKHAKDIAAAAVLICAIGAVVMGAMIFLPYL